MLSPQQVAKLKSKKGNSTSVDFLKDAFPEQRAFIEDPSQFKLAHCPRGAAKSYAVGLELFITMQAYPGCSTFYITKTRDMARNIMWRNVMKAIDKRFNVGIEFNETLLEGRHPNGSTFRLTGVDGDSKQQDKLLGGKYKLVVLDEVAFFDTDLTDIIYRTLMPAAARVAGKISMVSTSSDYHRGLFYEATRQDDISKRVPGWSLHSWSWEHNPYTYKEVRATLDGLIASNPLYTETNHYKQMYLNQWTIDSTNLVYKFNEKINTFSKLPALGRFAPNYAPERDADDWTYCLGVDFGYEDDNAWVLTAYHRNDPNLYIIKTFNQNHMLFDALEKKTKEFMSDPIFAPHKIVVDVSGKTIVESMRARTQIPFEYADKRDKADFIETLNGDLVQGKIKIHESCKSLISELGSLVWKTEQGKIVFPKKEKEGLSNHLCDAFLYSWRMGFHYQATPAENKVVVGSRQWYDQQAEQIWEREREKIERQYGEHEVGWASQPAFPKDWSF